MENKYQMIIRLKDYVNQNQLNYLQWLEWSFEHVSEYTYKVYSPYKSLEYISFIASHLIELGASENTLVWYRKYDGEKVSSSLKKIVKMEV